MSDDRFKALKSDPRYRLPSKKEARTAVDPRFKTLFTDQEFRKKAAVDRYGRKIKPEASARDLEKLYRLDQDEEDHDVEVEEEEEKKVKKGKKSKKVAIASDEESSEEDEDDDAKNEEAEADVVARNPMREGFSESESEEEDSEDDEEDDLMDATAGIEQTEEIPMGEVSCRIAAVNLDWDNIRAADLMAVAASFAPTGGKIENVTIYPSEFGRERLEREELEGPPREIFASSGAAQKSDPKDDEDDEDEDSAEESDDYEEAKNRLLSGNQATEESEFDTAALRAYQLERLKYYYAVITCSNPQTAKALYDAMDGREYLSSANFFDLRFIPDETSFEDDVPKDECSVLGAGYRPNEFRTEALTHSKVRLTWDDDDATRKEVQKRAFSRAEMDENDLMAYIGSDESDASTKSTKSTTGRGKADKKEAQRLKMRAALGLAEDGEKEKGSKKKGAKDEELGEMQITFTSGLTNAGGDSEAGGKKGVFENEPQDEVSTRERYIRKEKERKQARKERAKAARAGGESKPAEEEVAEQAKVEDEEDPFADPFFNDPAAATAAATSAARKANKAEKRAKKAAADVEAEGRRAELELLMAGEGDGVTEHFDMREIEKAEKEARRKGKGKKMGKKEDGKNDTAQADFEIDDKDERFGAVFDSHEFAIDPTNPRFKKTKGMVGLLEAGRKKRKQNSGEVEEEEKVEKRKKKARKDDEGGEENVQDLVARLKKR